MHLEQDDLLRQLQMRDGTLRAHVMRLLEQIAGTWEQDELSAQERDHLAEWIRTQAVDLDALCRQVHQVRGILSKLEHRA